MAPPALRARLQALQALVQGRAQGAGDPDAVALQLDGRCCGSIDPPLAARLAAAVPGLLLEAEVLRPRAGPCGPAGCSALLEAAARWLVRDGVVPGWRDERLDVMADDGALLATVDRCAVRALGITTRSVRLNGYAAPDRLHVARRSPRKRVDPGQWDNLAGGLVGAGEGLREAIVRETLEEAGLVIDPAQLVDGGAWRVCRRLGDGLLSDVVHVFDLDLAADTVPVNRDGEVERFDVWDLGRVLSAIEDGAFTVEASLALLDTLQRRAAA